MTSVAALTISLSLLASAFAQSPATPSPEFLWWEGESASRTNFPARHSFEPANATEAAVLSEGKWLGADGNWKEPLFAEYDLSIPGPGTWKLYARKFWKHGPFKWSLAGTAGEVTRDVALMDDAYIRQFLGANWVFLGDVKVDAAGKQTLRIDMIGTEGAACFDAFLLTQVPFEPRGKLKPGQKWNRSDPGYFPFEPDRDPYGPSAISMRGLNEAFAGENGRIIAKGPQFAHEKTGQPVRFWAINTGMESVRKDRAAIDEQARFFAKRGVNLVRIHGGIWHENDFTQLDTELADQIQYYVAALKREGIYTKLSTYFPLWIRFNDKTPGFPGYPPQGQHPFAIQFFNKDFQKIQQHWLRELLTRPNPYAGGVPLAKDPAVAMVELVNEDSYFFWTFTPYQNIPAPQMAILEKAFGDFLATRFGSVEKALAEFGDKVRGDDATAGRAGFVDLHQMFTAKSTRGRAQAEFLARHQRQYFTLMRDFLRSDAGYPGLVSASNWTVADQRTLMPLEKWSNALDFLDRHGYWSGPHEGERSGYSVSKGDLFDDRSALVGPVSTPLYETQWLDLPSTLSEINWTAPNRFRAEFPVLSALYGALQGNDAWFFFATSAQGYESMVGKFSISTPTIAGQWPATSLIYRKNLVKEAPTALRINAKLADLFDLKGAPVVSSVNLDMNRFAGVPASEAAADAISPFYYLVGRVETAITDTGAPTTGVDLSKYVNTEAKTVTSLTGELTWDFGKGLVTVSAPQANGVVGFLSRGQAIKTPVLQVASPLEYGSVLLVALDDKPLTESSRMLLQVMSEEKNFGFKAPGTGKRAITDLGSSPLTVREIAGQISLQRPDAATLTITPLDLNGYPAANPTPLPAQFALQPRTLYYLIEKQ